MKISHISARLFLAALFSAVSLGVSAQSPAPITVPNVTVVVSGSTGLEREKALDLAARQAMPQALQQMVPPVTGERADTFIRSQGDLTRYVKTVKIVKEVLVPSYTLTADLGFDTAKLYANLGGKMSTTVTTVSSTTVSATQTNPASVAPQVQDNRPKVDQTIELASSNPTEQFKLLGILSQLPLTTARLSMLSTRSAVYTLNTPLSLDEIEQQLAAQNLSTVPGSASAGTLRVSF